jgi:hypothetical protein
LPKKRVLLTEDKDFGGLVFASQAESDGVILMRFPGNARQTLAQAVENVIQEQGENLRNAFVVIQPGHVRINRMPNADTSQRE